MQNNKNILMYVPYVVVFGIWFNECFTMSHTIRGQMCVFVCYVFNVLVQQKHQELRTIIDVWVCHLWL